MTASAQAALSGHAAPAWFTDAKLGIFVHWGPYSVPGWAPTDAQPGVHSAIEDFRSGRNAYAEWYENSLRVPGSPTYRHHRSTYGDAPYSDFATDLTRTLRDWDPHPWVTLFAEAGARYVVLTTKHHDGFLLWPSAHPNPRRSAWQTERDVVGEVADAVRARGMRFGAYYSGGLDWTFVNEPIDSVVDLLATVPVSDEYARLVEAHYRELIARYSPSVLWNDIAMPSSEGLADLLVHYLEHVPDGAVNDRFLAANERLVRLAGLPAVNAALDRLAGKVAGRLPKKARRPALRSMADFATPEYASFDEPPGFAWETCRGLGKSFGFNRAEAEEDHLSVKELITSFVDVVSNGGNLLLNVGPDGGGRIPELQAVRLRALGEWLTTNGEAIYGTRPWIRSAGTTVEGLQVRFTQAEGALYAAVLGTPDRTVTLRGVPDLGTVSLLGRGQLASLNSATGIHVEWPGDVPESPAHVLRIGHRRAPLETP